MKAFLDTYALIEMILGNESYLPYLRHGVTNHLCQLEFHVSACRLQGEVEADAQLRRIQSKAIAPDAQDIVDASRIKRTVKGASYADALGYAMAQRRRIPYVTGDKVFKGLPGVVP